MVNASLWCTTVKCATTHAPLSFPQRGLGRGGQHKPREFAALFLARRECVARRDNDCVVVALRGFVTQQSIRAVQQIGCSVQISVPVVRSDLQTQLASPRSYWWLERIVGSCGRTDAGALG